MVIGMPATPAMPGTISRPGPATKSTGATPTPTLAPSFSTLPSISPTSGNVGATFNANDGVIANGIFASRRWLLSGTAIGTGTTVVPNVAGSLVLEVTATRANGSGPVVAASAAVTLSAVAPTLNALTLSSSNITQSSPATINILGATNGSTITANQLPAGMTLNSAARTISGTPTTATTTAIVLTEALAGATGSPRTSNVSITVVSSATPGAPVNAVAPAISGAPIDGTAWTFHVGEWTGSVTGFDIEIQAVEATPVTLLPRQAVTADTTGLVSGAVGKSVILNVWAKNANGETKATSAAFGPVQAAGDTFVIGLAWATAEQSLPQSPYPFTSMTGPNTRDLVVKHGGQQIAAQGVYPIPNPNPGMNGLSFGWNGSADAAGSQSVTAQAVFADPRLRGRTGGNFNASASHLRIDLPGAGTYRIYSGSAVAGSSAPVNLGVWDGPAGVAAGSLHQMGPVVDGDNNGMVVDINQNAILIADWQAAAGPGMGSFKEVTVGANAYITVGKSTASGASTPGHCSLAVFKKAA